MYQFTQKTYKPSHINKHDGKAQQPIHSWWQFYTKWREPARGLLMQNRKRKTEDPHILFPTAGISRLRLSKRKLAIAAIGSFMLLSSANGAVQAAGIQVNASCTLIDAITAVITAFRWSRATLPSTVVSVVSLSAAIPLLLPLISVLWK